MKQLGVQITTYLVLFVFSTDHTSAGECKSNSDMVFILDSSGSVSDLQWSSMLDTLDSFLDKLNIAKDGTHIGSVMFADEAQIQFHLNAYYNKADVVKHMRDRTYGTTKLAPALDKAREILTQGNRPDVSDTVILFTDGKADDKDVLPEAIRKLKQTGASVVAVGIGDYDEAQLKMVASTPDKVIQIQNFDQFRQEIEKVAQAACSTKLIPPTPVPETEGEGVLCPVQTCHCQNQAECNRNAGRCAGGCAKGLPQGYDWSGPTCQFGNLAYGKKTLMDGRYDQFVSSNGVNGITKGSWEFFTTGLSLKPWWIVDLNQLSIISNITLYNIDHYAFIRQGYFYLLTGNDTNIDNYKVYNYYDGTIARAGVLTMSCTDRAASVARYVGIRLTEKSHKIDSTTGTYMSFSEVVVLGKPYCASSDH